jgi:hypothetical protein
MTYDGKDAYGVTRDGSSATVRHYSSQEAREACCETSATVTDSDRAADREGLGWIVALGRAYAEIEKRHGR